jgi:hypothetical protein
MLSYYQEREKIMNYAFVTVFADDNEREVNILVNNKAIAYYVENLAENYFELYYATSEDFEIIDVFLDYDALSEFIADNVADFVYNDNMTISQN